MPLCEYELQRLANIASNQAVLDKLGLGGNNSHKKPKAPVVRKPKSDSDDDEDQPAVPTRRSTRNVGTPATYVELSDDFMCMEERGLLKRARRDTKQTAPRFDELQAAKQNSEMRGGPRRRLSRPKSRARGWSASAASAPNEPGSRPSSGSPTPMPTHPPLCPLCL